MTIATIDSHVHFWSVTQNDWYPALKPFAESVGADTINIDFLPQDYHQWARGLDVHSFVHVSATTAPRAFLKEAQWVHDLAEKQSLDLVMVGTIDPESSADQIGQDLDVQAEYSRFVGARVFPGIAPDSPAAAPLLGWLDRHNKIFDLVTDPSSAHDWVESLGNYPELSVAIEHTGSPNPEDPDGFEHWRKAMRTFAEDPRVVCKLTGLGMVTMKLDDKTLRPWIEETFEIFGADRVLFGSNVPIETMAGPYKNWIETLTTVLAGASEEERSKFFEGNARRVYWA